MSHRRAATALASVSAALVLLAGCGSPPASQNATPTTTADAALQTLVTAAQQEGELTWYSVPAAGSRRRSPHSSTGWRTRISRRSNARTRATSSS